MSLNRCCYYCTFLVVHRYFHDALTTSFLSLLTVESSSVQISNSPIVVCHSRYRTCLDLLRNVCCRSLGSVDRLNTLLSLEKSKPGPTQPYCYYTDQRIVANGFAIRECKGKRLSGVGLTLCILWALNCFGGTDCSHHRHHSAARRDLTIQHSWLAWYGSRSFATSGPSIWNSLPPTVCYPTLTSTGFCSKLKTELHNRAYGLYKRGQTQIPSLIDWLMITLIMPVTNTDDTQLIWDVDAVFLQKRSVFYRSS